MKIKGSVLKSRLAFVEQNFGREGLDRLVAALPQKDRELFHGLLTQVAWYPFEIGKRLDEAIVQVLAKGDRKVFEKLGEASAEKNLTTVHKHFLVPGDPHAFLAKAGAIYSFYYDTGSRDYRREGPRTGVLTTTGASTFSAADCLTVVGWYKRALELCGAVSPKVVEEECRSTGGKVCLYRVSWA